MPSAMLSLRDERPALDVAGHGHQIDVAEPDADLGGLAREGIRTRPVSLDRMLQGDRHEQMPVLGALLLAASSSRRTRASQPPARANSARFSRTKISHAAQRAARST